MSIHLTIFRCTGIMYVSHTSISIMLPLCETSGQGVETTFDNL